MNEIIRFEPVPLHEQMKVEWTSILKPVDNFTITEWPGKQENSSLICDIAIQNQDAFIESSSSAIIPYLNQETADYYEVFDITKEEVPPVTNEKAIDYADRLDKCVALASGLLTGLIDVLFVGEFSIEKAKQYGEKDVENIVKKAAKKFGYKGNDKMNPFFNGNSALITMICFSTATKDSIMGLP